MCRGEELDDRLSLVCLDFGMSQKMTQGLTMWKRVESVCVCVRLILLETACEQTCICTSLRKRSLGLRVLSQSNCESLMWVQGCC